ACRLKLAGLASGSTASRGAGSSAAPGVASARRNIGKFELIGGIQYSSQPLAVKGGRPSTGRPPPHLILTGQRRAQSGPAPIGNPTEPTVGFAAMPGSRLSPSLGSVRLR